jgi:hypothetical protein
MSIYEVATRMLGSDSRKLLGLITVSLVLPQVMIVFHRCRLERGDRLNRGPHQEQSLELVGRYRILHVDV